MRAGGRGALGVRCVALRGIARGDTHTRIYIYIRCCFILSWSTVMFHRFHPIVLCSRCFARQMHLNIPVRNDSHEQVCASGNGAYYCQKTHPPKKCASSSGISMGDLGILTWMKIVPPVPNVCERTTRGHHPIKEKRI